MRVQGFTLRSTGSYEKAKAARPGLRVQGSRFRVQGSGFRVYGSGFGDLRIGVQVQGAGIL